MNCINDMINNKVASLKNEKKCIMILSFLSVM